MEAHRVEQIIIYFNLSTILIYSTAVLLKWTQILLCSYWPNNMQNIYDISYIEKLAWKK